MIQVWYPARVESYARSATYMEHMPLQFSHLSLLRTRTYQDAPISDAQSYYPVLIFSHGYIGFAEQNLTLIRRLKAGDRIVVASHNQGKVREINELIRPFGVAAVSARACAVLSSRNTRAGRFV